MIHAPATCAVIFEAPTEYVDRTLATASWFDVYEIQPGIYPFEWVNINGAPWNADPEAITNGYIRNVGPYYAQVTLDVKLTREHRESRVGVACSTEDRYHHLPPVTTIKRTVYAYQIAGCPKTMAFDGSPLTEFLGGRVVEIALLAVR